MHGTCEKSSDALGNFELLPEPNICHMFVLTANFFSCYPSIQSTTVPYNISSLTNVKFEAQAGVDYRPCY